MAFRENGGLWRELCGKRRPGRTAEGRVAAMAEVAETMAGGGRHVGREQRSNLGTGMTWRRGVRKRTREGGERRGLSRHGRRMGV